MKKLSQRISALLLAGATLLPSARAARYTDLTYDHWAYYEMTRAVDLGILAGMGDGTMRPDDTLTWGQYLTMVGRAFCPDAYAQALAAGLPWDQAAYRAAQDSGILREGDFLTVDAAALGQPILRQDAVVLLDRTLPHTEYDNYQSGWDLAPAEEYFTDWAALTPSHQEALSRLYTLRLIQGREELTPEGSSLYHFDGGNTIRRADGSVLLMRVVNYMDRARSGEDITVTLHVVDPQGSALCPDRTVTTTVGTWTDSLVDTNYLWHYAYQEGACSVSSIQNEYTVTYRPYTWLESAEEDFWDKVEAGEADAGDYWLQDFWLRVQGENDRKHQLLFGSADQRRYADKEEAAAHAATITVPVWKLDQRGNKVPSTLSLSVNAALAEDVTAIFTEIYNDPERFPICDLGGYSWRGIPPPGSTTAAPPSTSTPARTIRSGRARSWRAASGPPGMIPGPSPRTAPWSASSPSTAGPGAGTPGPGTRTPPRVITTICTSPTWGCKRAKRAVSLSRNGSFVLFTGWR